MKSIKPGRGPSALGGVGSIAAGVFGVIWMFAAAQMGAPSFFVLFGLVFVGLAVAQAIYHFKNATGKNRMSLFDITDHHSEPDPLDQYFNPSASTGNSVRNQQTRENRNTSEIKFCPYCGNKVFDASHTFCTKCGKQIKNSSV